MIAGGVNFNPETGKVCTTDDLMRINLENVMTGGRREAISRCAITPTIDIVNPVIGEAFCRDLITPVSACIERDIARPRNKKMHHQLQKDQRDHNMKYFVMSL